ncbi:immunoglobulin I-set domain protein, partial [Opisthorchis viverrini]
SPDSEVDIVRPDEAHLEGVPQFIQHPKSVYYTMKGHPAILDCLAEPVSHAAVVCAGKVIPYRGPEEEGRLKVTRLDANNQPDPTGSRWHLELQIFAKEVEEWFDSYTCRCEAWSRVTKLQRPKKVLSRESVIIEAYLEQKFQVEPISTNLTVGDRLTLSCVPPRGKPEPEVYWLKDGIPIKPGTMPQILMNDYNQLIIENATEHDSGNYTCVAECLAVEYRFAQSTVKVISKNRHVSQRTKHDVWQEWSVCSWTLISDATDPKLTKNVCQQTRLRSCFVKLSALIPLSLETDPVVKEQSVQSTCPLPFVQKRNCSSIYCPRLTMTWMSQTDDIVLNKGTAGNWREMTAVALYGGSVLFLIVLLAAVGLLLVKKQQLKRSAFYQYASSCCAKDSAFTKRGKQMDLRIDGDSIGTVLQVDKRKTSSKCSSKPDILVHTNHHTDWYRNEEASTQWPTDSSSLLRSISQSPTKSHGKNSLLKCDQPTTQLMDGTITCGVQASVETQDQYCVYSVPQFHP